MEPKKKSVSDFLFPLIAAIFVVYVALQVAVAFDAAANESKEGVDIIVFIDNVGDRLENKTFDIEWTKSSPKMLLFSVFFIFLATAHILTTRKNLISGKEHGTAAWSTPKDLEHLWAVNQLKLAIKELKAKKLSSEEEAEQIKALNEQYKNADMILTETEKVSIYNYEMNNNVLIVGGSGAGKTRGYVMPNLLQAHSSYVTTDPKGEILGKSGHYLQNVEGYKIRVLNLDEKHLSNGYNPLHYIHKEREGWEERVLSLIETIIINTDGGESKGGSDPFWDKAERLFLQSIIFATVEAFPPDECNLNTSVELIRWLKIKEDEDNLDSDLDLFFRAFGETYGEDHIGYQQYWEFREKASGKTAKSIVISAVARLAPFKVKEVKRILSRDQMYLDRVGEEKTAVFVIMPPIDKTYSFIAGMFFTQLFQELNYCALNKNKNNGERLPVPVRLILDEFANTCKIPNFVSILAYARSLGIGITTILQSLEQIKNMYEKEWGVIVDNSNSFLYLGKVTHMDTLKYISELIGKATFDKKSSGKSLGKQNSTSTNVDSLGRDLLDPSEVRKIKNSKCLLVVGGMDAFYSKKYNYKKHPNYKHTSDSNKKLRYNFVPEIPKPKETPKATHSEDVTNKKSVDVFEKIKVEQNVEVIASYLTACLLNSDFDSDEIVSVDVGESEEMLLFTEFKNELAETDVVVDNILSNFIQTSNDENNVKAVSNMLSGAIQSGAAEFSNVVIEDGSDASSEENLSQVQIVTEPDVFVSLMQAEQDESGSVDFDYIMVEDGEDAYVFDDHVEQDFLEGLKDIEDIVDVN